MDDNMVRTQVYLPRTLHDKLQARAQRHDITMAAQIRAALEDYLERQDTADNGPVLRPDDPIFALLGRFAAPEDDLSTHHDAYLYGERVNLPAAPAQPARPAAARTRAGLAIHDAASGYTVPATPPRRKRGPRP